MSAFLMWSVKGLRRVSSWFFLRLACFLLLMAIAFGAGGWMKGPLWLAVFLVGVWAFLALIRESRAALDFLIPRLEHAWRWMAQRTDKLQGTWKFAVLLCAAVIVVIAIYRAWPIWHFKATSSLRDDEIMSIVKYTSRGFVPAISTYSLARNHIFYNVASSFLPGADSTRPLRARLISFVCVIGTLGLLVAYSARRGWLLPGLACAALVAVNLSAMDRILEARGYGLIFLFAMLGCVAFAEWLRTRERIWLNLMSALCVLGTYTLPFYVVFAGGLLLMAFFYRPSRETFLAGFFSLAAILMLYLPVLKKVYGVFAGYEERYGNTFISPFDSIDGVYSAFEHFLPVEVKALTFVLIALVALLYLAFGRFATRSDRLTLAGIAAAILGFLVFCLYCKTVPVRVASFLAAPLAFLIALMAGSVLSTRALRPVRPLLDVLLTAFVAVTLWKSQVSEPLIPSRDWRGLGVLIERVFPKETSVWITEKYRTLLQWSLSTRIKPEQGALDFEAFGNGELVAVEGFSKPSDEPERFRWENLPPGVRFVTLPVIVNYQRVFFVPPRKHGIASISVDNQRLEAHVSGRQPYDPVVLSQSVGHGDVLRPKDGETANAGTPASPEAQIAHPAEISLPATLTVELDSEAPAGTCNFLFSQGLHDKLISAEVKKAGDDWRATSNIFIRGELLSVALPSNSSASVRIHLQNDPGFSHRVPEAPRPPLGLIEAWTAAGKTRLP